MLMKLGLFAIWALVSNEETFNDLYLLSPVTQHSLSIKPSMRWTVGLSVWCISGFLAHSWDLEAGRNSTDEVARERENGRTERMIWMGSPSLSSDSYFFYSIFLYWTANLRNNTNVTYRPTRQVLESHVRD